MCLVLRRCCFTPCSHPHMSKAAKEAEDRSLCSMGLLLHIHQDFHQPGPHVLLQKQGKSRAQTLLTGTLQSSAQNLTFILPQSILYIAAISLT